ncbi:MAG: DUF3604 domain-containing protein [Armatimonadota bacterium]
MRTLLAFLLCVLVPCACVAFTTEEEGRARIVSGNSTWVAGSNARFEIEYTVGSKGIPAGGGVAVAFPHALNIYPKLDPGQADYVRVVSEDPDVRIEYREWAQTCFPEVGDINSKSHNLRHGIFVTTTHNAIKPGARFRFVFGANDKGMTIPRQVCESAVRVAVDLKGDGKYFAIQDNVECRIVPGPLHHFFVTVPSTRAVGDEADICVRAEDEYTNLATACNVEVVLSGVPDADQTPVKLKDGVGRAVVRVTKAGVYRVTATGGGLTAHSNPMVVTDKPPEYGVYWGDLHGHTQLSDGLGKDADYYYNYARHAADLDVAATAEHGYHEEARIASKRHNRPGEFVTIWGFEWSETKPGRLDRNIYFRSEDVTVPDDWPSTIGDWWKMLERLYGDNNDHRVIVGPHIFTYKTAAKPWYETWDARYERFVEIYSEHGMSEFNGNPRMLAGGNVQEGYFVQDGLKYGRRFGIIACSDTHDSHPGRGSNSLVHHGGITAFLATDLTREGIWDAWWNRRVYATTGEHVYIDFRIDGHVMGEEFTASGKPRIDYTVHGCDDSFEVFVVRNNRVIASKRTTGGSVKDSFIDDAYEDSSYYYLRVVQDNGEWAWSSPIWVDKGR